MVLTGIPSTSHLQPVSETELSDSDKKHLSPSQNSEKQYSASPRQDVYSASAGSSKSVSPQSKSSNSPKQMAEAKQDDVCRQLEEIDLISFDPSPRYRELNSSHDQSLRLNATEGLTGRKKSPFTSPSLSENGHPASLCLLDLENPIEMKSAMENPLPVVSSSSALPLTAAGSCGVFSSSVYAQSSPVKSTTSQVEKCGAGRGKTILAMLKGSSGNNIAVGIGMSSHVTPALADAESQSSCESHTALHDAPVLIDTECPSSYEQCAVLHSALALTVAESQSVSEPCTALHGSKAPPNNVNLEQILLSAGLDGDEDFNIHAEPLNPPHLKNGLEMIDGPPTMTNAYDRQVNINNSGAERFGEGIMSENLIDLSAESNPQTPIQSMSAAVLPPEEQCSLDLFGHQTTSTMSASQPFTGPGPPLSYQSLGSLERSSESDQSASSKMLSKRLPKIAVRSGTTQSGSRMATPVPALTQTSIYPLSYSSFSDGSSRASPISHRGLVDNNSTIPADVTKKGSKARSSAKSVAYF